MTRAALALLLATGCARAAGDPAPPAVPMPDAAPVSILAAVDPAVAADPPPPQEWLKGNTHVHAAPSGDSRTPIADVIAWYRANEYDFIALTDHNRVSEVGETSTAGQAAVHTDGLIVLSGVELTYNPAACDPPPPAPGGKCRIHANVIGLTARPEGRIEWANRDSPLRVDSYQRAIDRAEEWGGVVQINHPSWHWGMTADLLFDVAGRGARLVEIANKQFMSWSEGDDQHPSIEQLWDEALRRGATIWGISSDDAHDYGDVERPRYPAGGHFVMVHAAREPAAILEALEAGRFYASTGVLLARAESDGAALIVEISDDSPGEHVITFIGDGEVLSWEHGRAASRALAGSSYVRAVVRREDGARAWVQPARRAD